MEKRILVPIDFTDITETALKYAIGAAKRVDRGIDLLHVIDKAEKQPEAEDKLNALIYKYNYAGVSIKSYTKVGSIFDGIGEAADELGSALIFMGTHGMKGLQYLLGSHALRVVTNSKIPFIITQDRLPKDSGIGSIVVPMDLGIEEKQVLTAVSRIAKTFKAKVHLFVARRKDEFLENSINRNVGFAKRYLEEHEVEHTSTRAATEDGYEDQLIRFADSIDADMIAIVNHREDGIKNLFSANFDQNIITNKAKIPVLIINTKDTTAVNDIFGVFS